MIFTYKKIIIKNYYNLYSQQSIEGKILAREMISDYLHKSPEEIIFGIGPYGKPFVQNSSVQFNISHSGIMVACCISQNPVGIDVEEIRPIDTQIVRKVCTKQDICYIFGQDNISGSISTEFNNQQLYRFYEVWTAKEAYFKCIGTGILDLKLISIQDLMDKRQVFQVDDYIITIMESL